MKDTTQATSLPWDVRDPMSGLPPTARRLLVAGRHLLDTEGFKALTLSRIAGAAGEHKASIGYYFGNKAGFVSALADYVVHDYTVVGLAELEGLPVGEKRTRAAIKTQRRIAADTGASQAIFEILVPGIRDPEIRDRMARAYDRYRSVHLQELLGDADDEAADRVQPLAALCLAIMDGLAIQALLGLDGPEFEAAFRYWEDMVARLPSADWLP